MELKLTEEQKKALEDLEAEMDELFKTTPNDYYELTQDQLWK